MTADARLENAETEPAFLLSLRFAPGNVIARRAAVLDEPVRRLNKWVQQIRDDPRLPHGAGVTIPRFDPRGGGVTAPIVLLMQDPSEVATLTGIVSPDNNDPIAQNLTRGCRDAGLVSHDTVHWNVCPWRVNVRTGGQVADPKRPEQSHAQARDLAVVMLREFFDLLENPRVIVLLGREAQKAYDSLDLEIAHRRAGIETLRCPSCSRRAWNNVDRVSRRRNSDVTVETLTCAKAIAFGSDV